ncbi:hypothetical protein Tsubulata_020529 [Turnera subulata]|uniref:Protein root UVB sensitive 3 n=1 Tax=Turnera subulata TaxID=218843 RepID=A0A9Q0JD82_9ROSI|nr:hypothetical protein Tsubulata_020529 [Turnera subulata]
MEQSKTKPEKEKEEMMGSSPSSSSSHLIIEEWNGSSSTQLSLTATITASPSLSIQRSGRRFDHLWTRILEAFVPEASLFFFFFFFFYFSIRSVNIHKDYALHSNDYKAFLSIAGMLLDLVSPLFPSAFVFVVCLGSVSRSFTGVASGATRAALTQHFALQNNAADISAKEGSQETVATMIGMALGMLLAHITIGSPFTIWFCFLSLTMFHMYANYRAVRCLALNSLNIERSSILLQHFMGTGQVLSPEQVSRMEHVLPSWAMPWCSKDFKMLHTHVNLGVRVSSFDHQKMMDVLHSAGSHYSKARYLLVEKNGGINVVIHKDATALDVLQSFIHALVMTKLGETSPSVHSQSQLWMDKHYELFVQKLNSSGWKTGRLLSPSIVWRANWTHAPSDLKTD